MNQDIALTLLQASITGAGLTLTAYALIIPLSKRLFELRAKTSANLIKEFQTKVIESKSKIKDGEDLKELIDKITETQDVPDYLRIGMMLTFLGYVVSTLLSYGVAFNWERPSSDTFLSFIFVLTTVLFLIVGLTAIIDIQKIMKGDLAEVRESLCKPKD